MSDPFKLTYDYIWAVAERQSAIQSLVKGSKIKYNRDVPALEVLRSGDTPELALKPIGGEWPIQGNSHTTKLVPRWQWLVTTGTLKPETMFSLWWGLTRALYQLSKTRSELTFENKPLIERIDSVSNEAADEVSRQQRSVKGWISILTFETTLQVPNSSLTAD